MLGRLSVLHSLLNTLADNVLRLPQPHGHILPDQDRLFEPDFKRSVELLEPLPERWSDYLLEIVGDYIF